MAMTWLALAVALTGLGLAALALQRSRTRGAYLRAGLSAGLGLLLAWGIVASDRAMRARTLFEVLADGSLGVPVGAPAPVRAFEVMVEHPGTPHSLMLAPSSTQSRPPAGEAELAFRLLDPRGAVLLEQRRRFEVRTPSRNQRHWEAAHWEFLPQQPGPHRLEVTVLSVDVPHLHVRVEDPLKTDGQRIPGF